MMQTYHPPSFSRQCRAFTRAAEMSLLLHPLISQTRLVHAAWEGPFQSSLTNSTSGLLPCRTFFFMISCMEVLLSVFLLADRQQKVYPWQEYFTHPPQWSGNRMSKTNTKVPDVKHSSRGFLRDIWYKLGCVKDIKKIWRLTRGEQSIYLSCKARAGLLEFCQPWLAG